MEVFKDKPIFEWCDWWCQTYYRGGVVLFIAIGALVLGYGAWLVYKRDQGWSYMLIGAAMIVSSVIYDPRSLDGNVPRYFVFSHR